MMIRINLLPDELRRSERSSPKVFAATLLAVILVCSTVGWFGYVYFGELSELEVEHRQVDEMLTAKNEAAAYHDALVAERAAYQNREATIRKIGISRMLWTEFMDQLIDLVNNEGNTARHLAWFGSAQVSDGGDRAGPIVVLPGQVQGGSLNKVANFHEDMEGAPFFPDVAYKSLPSGELKIDAKRNPPESYAFGLQLTFKPASEWRKNQAGAPAAGPR